MCISCRERFSRCVLVRLQIEPQSIIRYSGVGRSFYLCEICATNQKKQTGLAKRFRVSETNLTELLKEILNNG
jgi:predicted RNA-binding protein YlxR (DUF448 family)